MTADRVLTRRAFLGAGAGVLAAAVAPPRFLARAAHAAEGRQRVVVALFQRGAVDGLSMVVPHGDPGYAPARPGIALQAPAPGQPDRAIDLDGFFAVHPALGPLLPLWQDRALAIVHACGSPDPTRSHFDAQDYMETGTPGVRSTPGGWLGRAAGGLPSSQGSIRAAAIAPSLPRALQGGGDALALERLADLDPGRPAADARVALEALYAAGPGAQDPVVAAGATALAMGRLLEARGAARLPVAAGAAYPAGRLGDALRQIAGLVKADVGLAVAFADVGGWDTHVLQGSERGPLANRLRELGLALAAFTRDLGDRMADVVVVTMSEFGRTVAENGNRGTDHGHGTAMLVLGGRVRGGRVYGRWPGLAPEQRFEGRDLAVTTDFRTLFAEIAAGHLGVAPAVPLFPGWTPAPPLGLLA